jgi:uncharacterized protein (UPF0147 family)
MSEDPRWHQLIAFLTWAKSDGERDGMEYVRRFKEYCNILEALAGDPNVTADERTAAKEILADITVQCRAHTPSLLHRLAEIANNPKSAADLRTEAKHALARATERMPAASKTRH